MLITCSLVILQDRNLEKIIQRRRAREHSWWKNMLQSSERNSIMTTFMDLQMHQIESKQLLPLLQITDKLMENSRRLTFIWVRWSKNKMLQKKNMNRISDFISKSYLSLNNKTILRMNSYFSTTMRLKDFISKLKRCQPTTNKLSKLSKIRTCRSRSSRVRSNNKINWLKIWRRD